MKFTKKQMERIRDNLRATCKVGTQFGVFRVNNSESLSHNLEVARQFTLLSYEGFAVAVRPTLLNGNIPDIMILNTAKPQIKEILSSESDKRFAEKNYLGINKIKVRINAKK